MSKIKNPAAIAAVQKEVEGLKSQIIGMGDKLWTIAELSLQEEESAAYLIGELQDNDFNIDSVGTSNIPTAFTASYGSGSPVIGIMTEYDALPDLGQEPVAEKTPRKDGKTSGHGCGHNLIGEIRVRPPLPQIGNRGLSPFTFARMPTNRASSTCGA